MKKIIVLIVMFVVATSIIKAQDGINYQAVVRDNSGELMKNEAVAVEFSIVKTSTVGVKVYTETHALTTNNFGNIVAIIGQGTPTLGTFGAVDWASDKHFLNVKIDGTEMGTTEFLSVPYALHAKTADALTNPNWIRDGQKIYNSDDAVVIGTSNADADKLTVYKSKSNVSSELVDFRVDTLNSNEDLLNLNYNYNSGFTGQFIEMSKGGSTTFRFNTDSTLTTPARTGNANMLPIAYGNISSNGTINSATSNVSNVLVGSTGNYTLDITGETINMYDYIVVLNSINASSKNISWGNSGSKLIIYVKDIVTNSYTAGSFNFIIYKP